MSKKVVVIGGGIMGLSSAYFLQKEGHKVTVIDQSNMDVGASYVNAGYLAPSHIIPLSAPGVMRKGLKWMFDKSSPLYIKPRLDLDFLRWTWAFNKSCNLKHVEKAGPILKDITILSQELYKAISELESINSHYEKKGLLMLCQTEKVLEEELNLVYQANKLDLEAREVSALELKELEPNIEINAIGAAYFECDHHSTPHEFMSGLKDTLKNKGVQFYPNEKVIDLQLKNRTIDSIKTNKQILKADEYVLAAGSWSNMLSKKLGIKLLLQAGKGYRINTRTDTGITIPAILTEAKVAVTPMNGFTRFAGTMEIAGINHSINKVRVEAIANAAKKYYSNIDLTQAEKNDAACGLRPLSPDGLPFIGKSKKCPNLTFAAGHAMLGWSMGSATGKLVSEIIGEQKLSLDLKPFNPDRKF